MPQHTSTQIVRERTTVQTVNGEVTINLNLTIRLENGQLSVSAAGTTAESEPVKKPVFEPDRFAFEIPDLESGSELLNFGKNVGEN